MAFWLGNTLELAGDRPKRTGALQPYPRRPSLRLHPGSKGWAFVKGVLRPGDRMRGCIGGKRVEGYLGCGGPAIPQGPSKGPEGPGKGLVASVGPRIDFRVFT